MSVSAVRPLRPISCLRASLCVLACTPTRACALSHARAHVLHTFPQHGNTRVAGCARHSETLSKVRYYLRRSLVRPCLVCACTVRKLTKLIKLIKLTYRMPHANAHSAPACQRLQYNSSTAHTPHATSQQELSHTQSSTPAHTPNTPSPPPTSHVSAKLRGSLQECSSSKNPL